ncbi:hypothetical protein VNO77_26776 [Canavalia gladiata]|uniref:Uncharacterized protein n=1 Tax=Canavalia gladiata TaxID=3824 RepID=A0AAN9KTN1_CANGL
MFPNERYCNDGSAKKDRVPGVLKIRHIGQTTLGSAAVFSLFLAAGTLILFVCFKSYTILGRESHLTDRLPKCGLCNHSSDIAQLELLYELMENLFVNCVNIYPYICISDNEFWASG